MTRLITQTTANRYKAQNINQLLQRNKEDVLQLDQDDKDLRAPGSSTEHRSIHRTEGLELQEDDFGDEEEDS